MNLTVEQEKVLSDNISNRWWRLNNLYHVRDEKGQDLLFQPNLVQRMLYRCMWFLNLVLKARQHGVTTFICILFLDACLFNSNTEAGIVAHNRQDAEEFFHNKVKYAYDNLPGDVRFKVVAETDTVRQLRFSNGSSIRVGTSLRSGTLQYLHVSEFGKICAKYPEKAREIVTGSLNTIHPGQFIFIESTAEGRHGYFYDYCKVAQDMERMGTKLSLLDFKFFFFPWWNHPGYVLDPVGVVIPVEMANYFSDLAQLHGIVLSPEQKAFYVKKAVTQQEDMFREYPSTPEEAFLAAIKGAYYAVQMAKLRKDGRLTMVPHEPGYPVNTGWDLGRNDSTAIWFHQRIGLQNRIIDYYENSGEDIPHYVKILQERGYIYGDAYMPHDVTVQVLGMEKTRLQIFEDLGMKNIYVISREMSMRENVSHGIEAVRLLLNSCWIDEEKCSQGVTSLDGYQKEWDEKHGCFRDHPLHNWAEHGASAFRMLALGYSPKREIKEKPSRRRRDGRVV